MLSQLIHNGTARVDPLHQIISLSHIESSLKIDHIPKIYLKTTTLNLTYCKLQNLKGIEQFEELKELNIKFN